VSPGPPAAVNVVIQRSPTSVAVKLAGDWLTPGSTTFTVKCSATVTRGVVCTPGGMQNTFGCDTHGPMVLKEINGIAPTTGKGRNTVLNPAFPATFDRTLFEVVPWDSNTVDHIPRSESGKRGGVDLQKIFARSGWACTSKTAQTDIKTYGFVPIGAGCGSVS